jgi:MFS transporter
VQTGFGPFISVYLTAHGWTQVDIGLVLTARGLAALALQMPGGAIVDAARSERGVAALAMIAISASALVIALWPMFPAVLGAQILHAAGSSVVSPAIAAISLGLVGHAASGERFGRNARFASIGNGLAAAGMGAVGYFWSNQAVFLVTAVLMRIARMLLWAAPSKLREQSTSSSHVSRSRWWPAGSSRGCVARTGRRFCGLLRGEALKSRQDPGKAADIWKRIDDYKALPARTSRLIASRRATSARARTPAAPPAVVELGATAPPAPNGLLSPLEDGAAPGAPPGRTRGLG